MAQCSTSWSLDKEAFTLQQVMDAGLFQQREFIEDISDAADQQAGLETKLAELKHKWSVIEYDFVRSARGTPMLTGASLSHVLDVMTLPNADGLAFLFTVGVPKFWAHCKKYYVFCDLSARKKDWRSRAREEKAT